MTDAKKIRNEALEEAAQRLESFLELLSPEGRYAFEIAALAVRSLREPGE